MHIGGLHESHDECKWCALFHLNNTCTCKYIQWLNLQSYHNAVNINSTQNLAAKLHLIKVSVINGYYITCHQASGT